jgi:hypothetical protein
MTTHKPDRPRCQGDTSIGAKCIAYAREGSVYCSGHDPELAAQRRANGAKRVRWRSTRDQLQSHAGIAAKLVSIFDMVEKGRLELDKAKAQTTILRALMAALDGVDARLGQGRDAAPAAAPAEPMQHVSGDEFAE